MKLIKNKINLLWVSFFLLYNCIGINSEIRLKNELQQLKIKQQETNALLYHIVGLDSVIFHFVARIDSVNHCSPPKRIYLEKENFACLSKVTQKKLTERLSQIGYEYRLIDSDTSKTLFFLHCQPLITFDIQYESISVPTDTVLDLSNINARLAGYGIQYKVTRKGEKIIVSHIVGGFIF